MDGGVRSTSAALVTIDVLHETLRNALRKRRFGKVSHVANIFRTNMKPVPLSYALFAHCYECMAEDAAASGNNELAATQRSTAAKFRFHSQGVTSGISTANPGDDVLPKREQPEEYVAVALGEEPANVLTPPALNQDANTPVVDLEDEIATRTGVPKPEPALGQTSSHSPSWNPGTAVAVHSAERKSAIVAIEDDPAEASTVADLGQHANTLLVALDDDSERTNQVFLRPSAVVLKRDTAHYPASFASAPEQLSQQQADPLYYPQAATQGAVGPVHPVPRGEMNVSALPLAETEAPGPTEPPPKKARLSSPPDRGAEQLEQTTHGATSGAPGIVTMQKDHRSLNRALQSETKSIKSASATCESPPNDAESESTARDGVNPNVTAGRSSPQPAARTDRQVRSIEEDRDEQMLDVKSYPKGLTDTDLKVESADEHKGDQEGAVDTDASTPRSPRQIPQTDMKDRFPAAEMNTRPQNGFSTAASPPGTKGLEVDHVQALAGLICDAKSVAKRPGCSHIAVLDEYLHPEGSVPVYTRCGANAIECSLRLRASQHLRDAGFCQSLIRCQAEADDTTDARQEAARKAWNELELRATKVAAAAVERLKRGLLRLTRNVWKRDVQRTNRNDALKRAQSIILYDFYGGKVRPFGSHAGGLAQKQSDVDLEVVLPKPDAKMSEIREYSCHNKRVLLYLARRFEVARMSDVSVVHNARVPVLRYLDVDHQVRVDISIATSNNSVLLTRLIRRHMLQDTRLWEVAMLVKHWSYSRCISKTFENYICSVGWTTMAIYFLRQQTPPIGSFFEVRHADSPHDCRDVAFQRISWKSSLRSGTNNATTAELVTKFFEFYSNFDFKRVAIELRQQRTVLRSEMGPRYQVSAVVIDNPIVRGVNMAEAVLSHRLDETLRELRRAHLICLHSGDLSKLCATHNNYD
jgi:predicted nucleotidyltransferase